MIFQHTWRQVLTDEKRQTRRLVNDWEGLDAPLIPTGRMVDCGMCNGIQEPEHDWDYSNIDCVYIDDEASRRKWYVGQTLAVQPGRGKTNLYQYSNYMFRWDSIHDTGSPSLGSTIDQAKQVYGKDWRQKMTAYPNGWFEARIRITAIRQERLQGFSIDDLEAEGFRLRGYLERDSGAWVGEEETEEEFATLWNTIHTKPGTRWEDDPLVWVLCFELVQDVLEVEPVKKETDSIPS